MRHPQERGNQWPPAGSIGALVGGLLAASGSGCGAAAAAVAIATPGTATIVLAAVLFALAASVVVIAVAITWSLLTLSYVLDATGVEVRFGASRIRIPFAEMEGVRGAPPGESLPPVLWPGAIIGFRPINPDGPSLWRATTSDPSSVITITARGTAFVLTPADARAFRTELIERAQAAIYVPGQESIPSALWLDRLAELDGWVRIGVLAAVVSATVGLVRDAALFATTQPDTLVASAVAALNCSAALALGKRAPYVGRILAGAGIAAQLVAVFL